MQEKEVELSAFNLKIFIPSVGKDVSVENIFQGSKVYSNCKDLIDLYFVDQGKKDIRLTRRKCPGYYFFDNKRHDVNNHGSFYNMVFIYRRWNSKNLANTLLQYDVFTDIELNPQSSDCCQAKAAAIYVGKNKVCNNQEIVNSVYLNIYGLQNDYKSGLIYEENIPIKMREKIIDLYKQQVLQLKIKMQDRC